MKFAKHDNKKWATVRGFVPDVVLNRLNLPGRVYKGRIIIEHCNTYAKWQESEDYLRFEDPRALTFFTLMYPEYVYK